MKFTLQDIKNKKIRILAIHLLTLMALPFFGIVLIGISLYEGIKYAYGDFTNESLPIIIGIYNDYKEALKQAKE